MVIPMPAGPQRLFLLLICCAGISSAIAEDPFGYRYRSDVNEVRLSFSALDENNRGITTLQASDFAVVDKDIVVRNFRSFTRSEWSRVNLALLVDASGSMKPGFAQEVARVLDLISQMAGMPEENTSLISFHDLQPALLCATDCRTAVAKLPKTEAHGLTPLFDSIVFASSYLAGHAEPQAHKVVIVFSDGADTISRHSLNDAIEAAIRNEVQVDCIRVDQAASSSGTAVLQDIAASSGGFYFAGANTASAMEVILQGLRASYTVTYRLPSDGPGFHSVRVFPTHNSRLQFRTRSGYYYPDRFRN